MESLYVLCSVESDPADKHVPCLVVMRVCWQGGGVWLVWEGTKGRDEMGERKGRERLECNGISVCNSMFLVEWCSSGFCSKPSGNGHACWFNLLSHFTLSRYCATPGRAPPSTFSNFWGLSNG